MHKREACEGGPHKATPINFRFTRRGQGAIVADMSESGVFKQCLTLLYY